MTSGAPNEMLTFQLPSETRAELDALGRAVARDRSFLINEALAAYLALNRGQVARIAEGLRQAEAGVFATEAEVKAAYRTFE